MRADCNLSYLAPQHFPKILKATFVVLGIAITFRAKSVCCAERYIYDGRHLADPSGILRCDLCRGHVLVIYGSQRYNVSDTTFHWWRDIFQVP